MTPSNVETFDYGTQRYYLDDRRIVVVVGGGDMRRPSVDVWAELMKESINTFPDPAYTYMMLDITHPNQGFTPYTSAKSNEIVREMHPERHLYLAIVYRDSVINSIIGVFLNRIKLGSDRFTYRAFSDSEREKAIAWLREQREKTTAPAQPPQ